MDNEFPPNSIHGREARKEPRAVEKQPDRGSIEPVVTGKVIQRKRPLHKKFVDAFRPEDNKGFLEYLVLDLLATSIKDALHITASAALDNAFGVDVRHSRGRRSSGRGGYTSYNRMSNGSRGRDRRDDDRPSQRRDNRPMAPEEREFIFETRAEANDVLDMLIEMISMYDNASMRDLLKLSGESHTFTDVDWGWTDLRGARIHPIQGGYLLDLPRPEYLD